MPFPWIKSKGIHHVCLRVRDQERTVRFYQEALDARFVCAWGPEGTDDHGVLLDLGEGDILEIFHTDAAPADGVWQHIAVYVDDMKASFAKALVCGAQSCHEPECAQFSTADGDPVGMCYAFVRAPGGEMIELIQNCQR